jgi:hypothetical protein
MLAGPPRLLSLITILVFLILAWWYLRLVREPLSPGLRTDTSPPPKIPYRGGKAPDFGIPLRFTDGTPKPRGTNYTHVLVVPKTKKEDLQWMASEIPDTPLVVYEVDNPDAENKIPKNKGREAMVSSAEKMLMRHNR